MRRHFSRRTVTFVIACFLVLLTALPAQAGNDRATENDNQRIGAFKDPVLDSQLARIARDARAGRSIPEARGAGDRDDRVAVTLDVAGDPAAAAAALAARGIDVANVGRQSIEALVAPGALDALGSAPGVRQARELQPPVPLTVVSQGAQIHRSPQWNARGYTGVGVKIGVIDLGFTGFSALIGSELPVPITRCYEGIGLPTDEMSACEQGGVHGTAVTETLMDIAPDASLYIANPQSLLDLHDAVDWMISQGVTIINHSVGWTWEGPGDGTSPYADGALAAVDRAVAAGVTWINAAGNEGLSTWSGPWADADNDGVMEFTGNAERNAISALAGQEIILQLRWQDSWTNAASDIDLYLVSSSGEILRASEKPQRGLAGQAPFEFLRFTPTTSGPFYAVVRHYGGATPAWVQVQEFNGWQLAYATAAGSIANPAESASSGLLAVGATAWSQTSIVEPYSSRGPTRDGRIKPDVVGIDFADTVTYGASGFPGTSQAAPHIAGLAALVEQRFPTYGPAEIAAFLKAHGDHSAAPDNSWGAGLVKLPEIVDGQNPTPALVGATPASITVGSFPLNLTVSGAGFVPDATVQVNGEARVTTFVSPTTLNVALLEQDTDDVATLTITVVNPAPGGGVSNAIVVEVQGGPVADTSAFARTWQGSDEPVRQIIVTRTWMWGDEPFTGPTSEPYVESPGHQRTVQYYDKSRMEITNPGGDAQQLWYVTNGLLVRELITGQMQVGDAAFEPHAPAEVNAAGDPDGATGPTYASFAGLLDTPPLDEGAVVVQQIDRAGAVTTSDQLASYGVTASFHVQQPGLDHRVASVFWDFMNSEGTIYRNGEYVVDKLFENPFYATGYPITEAYWTWVQVGGIYQNVLIQCFERRCLTYTPNNPEGWEVEAGNVGRHYYQWRYGVAPPER
ncbi:MAG TPA: S8 family serine peptidase [Thermomicrobiales bacterium]|nr:S8 family serine peptidase [Thermomicrobiales bacterium]